jgi:hypothetical protein
LSKIKEDKVKLRNLERVSEANIIFLLEDKLEIQEKIFKTKV